MKIIKIVVTDTSGVEHLWEGTEGYVSIMSLAARPAGAPSGALAVPYARQVQANLTIPLEREVNIVAEELDPEVSI